MDHRCLTILENSGSAAIPMTELIKILCDALLDLQTHAEESAKTA